MISSASLLPYSLFIIILYCSLFQAHGIPDAPQNVGTSNLMNLISFPQNLEVPGGKCLDGTQAGFYVRRGTNPKLFVIDLKGGGACGSQETCDERAKSKGGSSNEWSDFMEGGNTLMSDCRRNPDFCDATAVFLPYCTGDFHLGTRIESGADSFGYEFHGRYNFMLMIDMLEAEYGLGDADAVLLSGASAGAFGALLTVDWLTERLSNAVVKAAPRVGWFSPGALDDDLQDARVPPSSYNRFKNNTGGNDIYDGMLEGRNSTDPWLIEHAMDEQCVIDNADFPSLCLLIHVAYKYIESSIYIIQPLFDGVHVMGGAPLVNDIPANETEIFKDYVTMWGEAMRVSIDQIVKGPPVHTKPHPDGLFATSCIAHGAPPSVLIDGFNWLDLMHDWFFQYNDLEAHHQLVESCPGGDNSLPCNQHWDECRIPEWIIDPCTLHSKREPCKQDDECIWDKNDSLDTGSCRACSQFEDKRSCRDVGCIWDGFGQMCFAPTPSPTAAPTPLPTISYCNSILKKGPCKETSGCFWNRDDSIGLIICDSCDAIKEKEYCRKQAGCIWNGAEQKCI